MRIRHVAVAAGLALKLMSGQANAAYLIVFSQTSSGVVETGSGSLNINGLNLYGYFGGLNASVYPDLPQTNVGATLSDDDYGLTGYLGAVFSSSQPFGTGDGTDATSGTGPFAGFFAYEDGAIGVPTGYKSGDFMTSTALYAGQTIASLGLTPGTYVYKYTASSDNPQSALAAAIVETGDTITVQVSAVPLPASAPLFGAALLALGTAGFGVKRKKAAAAK